MPGLFLAALDPSLAQNLDVIRKRLVVQACRRHGRVSREILLQDMAVQQKF